MQARYNVPGSQSEKARGSLVSSFLCRQMESMRHADPGIPYASWVAGESIAVLALSFCSC